MDLSSINDDLITISINSERTAAAVEALSQQATRIADALWLLVPVANEGSVNGGWTIEGIHAAAQQYEHPPTG